MPTKMTKSDSQRKEHYYSEKPKSPPRLGIIHAILRDRNFEFVTASSVFSTKRVDLGTRILIENMVLPAQGFVLDIGCGYGPVGIVAARLNANLHLLLTDINRRAVLLSRQNAQKNHANNVEVRQGSLYEPVQGLSFKAILSNPPVSAGMQTVQDIITGAPRVLAIGGTLQMVVRSKIGKKTLPDAFISAFGNVSVLAIESGYRVLMAQKQ
jgi:16S rRNA (guanine1207-N2)-methyltransferase